MLLTDIISHHAERTPDRPAFYFRDQLTTYGQLDERIRHCAIGLAALGLTKGSTFALVVRNCPEFVITALALSRLGAVVVPINFLEKADRIALILKDAGAEGILTAREFQPQVTIAAKQVPSLKHFFLRDGEQAPFRAFGSLLETSSQPLPTDVDENDLMMLLYTSGTTGLPKGVMLTHRNFIANVEQCLEAIRVRPEDRFLCLLPLFHSFSWTTCLLLPFKVGAQVIMIESLLPFDPVIKTIWKYRVTIVVAVPQIYAALISRIRGVKALLLRFLNPVRLCVSGAAPLPRQVHEKFEKTFGVRLLEGYGLTETAPVSTLNPFHRRRIGTVGTAVPGVELSIRDEKGITRPTGEVGEIWIRGANVMKGYYHKPEETAEVLTSDGWLKSGDLGYLDDQGYLKIVDRKKDLIIVKGLNVFPQEIENVILQNEAIKEVAVVGKLDHQTGEETIRAFVTLKEGAVLDKSALFALCRRQLAIYKLPKEIIEIDQMPKNALQKILKKELRERP